MGTKAILGGQCQTLDLTCIVYFRNYFRMHCTVNTPESWLKGKKANLVIKGHRSRRRQSEMLCGKAKPLKTRSCPQLTESKLLTLPGKQVLEEG
jgi:hypothetical protein